MAGLIYCFNTVGDGRVYKGGQTQNTMSMRLKGYMGLSRPRTVVFSRPVGDSVRAEEMMLTLFRQCVSLKSRDDLGKEWFEDVSDDTNVLLDHLKSVADIVQAANPPLSLKNRPDPACRPLPDVEAVPLRGMERYFSGLDAFVNASTPLTADTADELVSAFEASDACPVFAEYLPSTRQQRISAVHQRHAHLFRAR